MKLQERIDKLTKPNIKKFTQRGRYSEEAEIVMAELINSYKLNQHNFIEAINQAIPNMLDAPASQRLFLELAEVLNQSQGEERVKEAIRAFEDAIGNSWGQNLGEIIYCSHVMGLDVENAMLDLYQRVKQGKKIEEYSKRKNNEARLMIKWLTPLSYIITTLIACKFFDISFKDFMSNQFHTSVGITWFTIMIIFYTISLAIYYLLTNRRMDI